VEQKEFYTTHEVAKILGLKEQTIRDYIKRGELPAHRFGKVLRIRKDDFDRFVEQRRTKKEE